MLQLTRQATCTALAVVADAPLPREFRLFKFGENPTSKGTFTLTPESAAACMAEFQREGVRLIVDLNHDSMNPTACALRADASDARAWFSLELRADGIWGANADWTPDGERRLREKTQAYLSPVFKHTKDGVIMAIVNAALCAQPATYDAPALVAATKDHSASTSALVNLCKALLVNVLTQSKVTYGSR